MLLESRRRLALQFLPAATRPARAKCAVEVALERWAKGLLGGIAHEGRVRRSAARLFHLTRPLHALGPADLRLLRLAAIVHDVGRCIDDAIHPQQGARLLLSEGSLPLAGHERRALAYLTRYHKGKVPPPGADGILRRGDDVEGLRAILALLRAADALDGRSLQSPRLLFALTGMESPGGLAQGDPTPTLWVRCLLDQGSPKARRTYGRMKKFRLLEEAFGCRVDLSVVELDAVELVA